jgi:tRNA nucleotidyltransferase (CCA-adding enzyme)
MEISKTQQDCVYIASAVAQEGGRAYFVGGCVRDFLLGKNPKDTDIEIYGLTAEKIEKILRKKFRIEIVGKSFGVWI